ncbi:hypothetical protein Scep_000358 [Stephania cephalantha]|uniref:DNA-(apurinic or apyrimidinic site) endonuclease 2 n=1 Tax=Stephania cephalantha TaxID=152367 RepID=A0AAP0L7F2_9MAGN
MAVKMVSYNVNGLRQRISQHGSLLKLLNSLQSDIICFQETKLSKEEITADLIMAEGYESFFSCTCTSGKGRTGYSGVATFCRVKSAFSSNEVALPVAAEEGFTGLLETTTSRKDCLPEIPTELMGLEGITGEDLLKVDSEGRCIITDHGHFVLFNIYGPRAAHDDIERVDFKRKFFCVLQKRWESFLKRGKRVFVVGDLNIAPSAIDCCDPGPDFEKNQFREWLRSSLVENGGLFFDVFREKHPQRQEAFTCWPVHNGAEEFNYGTRIDHILFSGPCLHQIDDIEGHNFIICHVDDCDILTQFKRWKPENVPRWKGGKSVKLEGSDHAPVFVTLKEIPELPYHNTPSLAARYAPKVRGFQQSIVTLLAKRQAIANAKTHEDSLLVDENVMVENCSGSLKRLSQERHSLSSMSVENSSALNREHEYAPPNSDTAETAGEDSLGLVTNKTIKSQSVHRMNMNKKAKNNSTQRKLGSYFQKKSSPSAETGICSTNTTLSRENAKGGGDGASVPIAERRSPEEIPIGNDVYNNLEATGDEMISSTKVERDSNSSNSGKDKRDAALSEWQRIQQLMRDRSSVPICKGHGEPCVARVVKKEGPNFGRKFYVCNRGEGPASNPEARCDYFKWADMKSGKKLVYGSVGLELLAEAVRKNREHLDLRRECHANGDTSYESS